MSWFSNLDDWLSRNPGVCLVVIVVLLGLVGSP